MSFAPSIFVALCYFLFGFGYIISGGFYHVGELVVILLVTFALCFFYFDPHFASRLSIPKDKNSLILLLKIIFLVNVALVGAKLGDSSQTNWMFFSAANRILSAMGLMLAATFLINNFKSVGKYSLIGLLVIAFLIRVFSVFSAPNPPTDIFYILRDGPKLFLQGRNPYELSYPSPYGVYIPTIIFHYGPVTPFIFLPAVYIFNDPRPTLILVEFATAALIYLIGRKRNLDSQITKLIMLIFLFHPVFSFMTENAWPESVITFLFLSSVYFVIEEKRRWLSAIALGLILAVKSVYVLPLLTLLVNIKSKLSNILLMLAIPFILSLPFLYANPALFLERTQVYVTNPGKIATVLAPTNISLSISALILKYTKIVLPTYIAAIPGILIAALCVMRRPKNMSLSLLSVFLVFMFLFMFGPFAFLYNFAMMGNILLISLLFFSSQKID